jgi:hypothetical protein
MSLGGDIAGNWIDANGFARGSLIRGGDRDEGAHRRSSILHARGARVRRVSIEQRVRGMRFAVHSARTQTDHEEKI